MADNFKPIQVGGEFIDYDALRNDEYINLPYAQKKIHNSQMFTVCHYNSALADNGTIMIHGSIPTGIYPYGEFALNVGGKCTMEIVEGGTLTGATALVAYNHNRNATIPSIGTLAYHSGTITGGSVVYQSYVAGGEKAFASGNGVRSDSEWIFKTNALTTFRVTNISGGAIGVSLHCNFYDGGTA